MLPVQQSYSPGWSVCSEKASWCSRDSSTHAERGQPPQAQVRKEAETEPTFPATSRVVGLSPVPPLPFKGNPSSYCWG